MNLPWKKLNTYREDGQGLVEYALILVLIAIVILLILTLLGTQVSASYARVIGALNGQTLTGKGTEAIITGFEVNVTQGGTSCTVTISNISAFSFVDGQVTGGVTISGTGYGAISGTSDAQGQVSIAAGGSSGGQPCNGVATVTLAGNSRSTSY